MLDELRISGLGVIDEAVLPLGPGLTAVTGETGAGKTMVVTGLMLLFGARADAARVRTGAAQASVDGRLLVEPDGAAARRVRDAGGNVEGGTVEGGTVEGVTEGGTDESADHSGQAELVLRRVVTAGGRSRAYAGGAPVPVTVLGELAEHLVAVHGQSDQQRLVRPAAQRAALDRFAGVDLGPFAAAYENWRVAEARLGERTSRAAELRREADLLAHGVAEIEAVAPEPGELDELTRISARLGHAEALTAAARQAHDALLGHVDDPVPDAADVAALVGAAARVLGQQQGDDAELDALAVRVVELASLAAELGADLGAYAARLDADPARLEQVESRRAQLLGLVRKYCDDPDPSLDGVLRWADSARTRLGQIDVSDAAIAELRRLRDDAVRAAADEAAVVSSRRRTAAVDLGAAVTVELAGLAMPQARIEIAVRTRPVTRGAPVLTVVVNGDAPVEATAGPDGVDEVEFLLQPHAGAPALPIGRGASGGELSRVMLALEVCLLGAGAGAGADRQRFGAHPRLRRGGRRGGRPRRRGGRPAPGAAGPRPAGLRRHPPRAGRRLRRPAHRGRQAGGSRRRPAADTAAGTASAGGITTSDVRLVAEDDRIRELARMLAGSDTDTAREHAAELLREAAEDRAGDPAAAAGAAPDTGDGRAARPDRAASRRPRTTAAGQSRARSN